MSRREQVDPETVRRMAVQAGIPLDPSRLGLVAEGLGQFLELSDSWEDLGLAFRFETGTFSYAQWPMQFLPAWDRPTPLNKHGVVGSDGELRRHGAVPEEDA